jgi:hypothetical protein
MRKVPIECIACQYTKVIRVHILASLFMVCWTRVEHNTFTCHSIHYVNKDCTGRLNYEE